MRFQQGVALILPAMAAATAPPNALGGKLLWSEEFRGNAGAGVDTNVWNVMEFIDTNAEVQKYTTSNDNLQISGGGTVQFVPRKSSDGKWTSGRIETVDSFTPEDGKILTIASSILIGTNPAESKQGMWPAFWALGDAMRHGTQWPQAGEIDIFEQVNGLPNAYGTVHCGTEQGGPCQEPSGRAISTAMPATGVFNTYSVKIDRTNPDWLAQTITWEVNGAPFSVLHGSDLGDAVVWASLAHSPLYLLLNVAVGGSWPGEPNDATQGGYGAMMEVQWVGVWSS